MRRTQHCVAVVWVLLGAVFIGCDSGDETQSKAQEPRSKAVATQCDGAAVDREQVGDLGGRDAVRAKPARGGDALCERELWLPCRGLGEAGRAQRLTPAPAVAADRVGARKARMGALPLDEAIARQEAERAPVVWAPLVGARRRAVALCPGASPRGSAPDPTCPAGSGRGGWAVAAAGPGAGARRRASKRSCAAAFAAILAAASAAGLGVGRPPGRALETESLEQGAPLAVGERGRRLTVE